jgi:radical SAM protein with 4Fe4S-binding SPASM domain
MHCPERKWPGNEEYLNDFYLKSARHRIPLSGSLELTYRCNLRCVHCYLAGHEVRQKQQSREMSTAKMLSLLDEITEAGCLNLLITGGEPLLREDFPEIYRHAKEKGLLVTVFSNGTLITEKVIELFRDYPPLEVEISIYGATAGTYEKITRVRGSFEKCMSGIKRLLDSNIKVNLKTILMTMNSHELFQMQNVAKEVGARFRFDAAISPCINGDKAPLDLRVSPEEAIEKEFADPKRVRLWKKYFEGIGGRILADDLYGCGAGVTGFHIDPSGSLQPCMMTLDIQHDLSESGFLAGWHDIISHIRGKKAAPEFACRGCEKINLCGYCPAFFRLENGTENARSDYICKMGHLRYQHLINHFLEGENHDTEERKNLQTAL